MYRHKFVRSSERRCVDTIYIAVNVIGMQQQAADHLIVFVGRE